MVSVKRIIIYRFYFINKVGSGKSKLKIYNGEFDPGSG